MNSSSAAGATRPSFPGAIVTPVWSVCFCHCSSLITATVQNEWSWSLSMLHWLNVNAPPTHTQTHTIHTALINSQRTHSATSTGLKSLSLGARRFAVASARQQRWRTENRCLFILQAAVAAAAAACIGKDVTAPVRRRGFLL